MKIINQNGYSRQELLSWRIIVYRNIIESAQAIVQAVLDFNLDFELPENAMNVQRLLDYQIPSDPKFELDPEIVDAIASLWADATVNMCVEERRHEFYLTDSAP